MAKKTEGGPVVTPSGQSEPASNPHLVRAIEIFQRLREQNRQDGTTQQPSSQPRDELGPH